MVVTIDSKFYSKLQLGISKYQEKTPADPLKPTKQAQRRSTDDRQKFPDAIFHTYVNMVETIFEPLLDDGLK